MKSKDQAIMEKYYVNVSGNIISRENFHAKNGNRLLTFEVTGTVCCLYGYLTKCKKPVL